MALTAVCLRSTSRAAPYKSPRFRKNFLPIFCAFCDDSTKKPNLYDTLGLPPSATRSEIKQAYFDLSFKYHPDRNENCNAAANKFREVNEAYEVLGNYSLKKKYDKGVPLSSVKKDIVKPFVHHNAKYQSFYDSRTTQSQDFTDGYGGKKEEMFEQYKKEKQKAEEMREYEQKSVVPKVVLFFLFTLFLFRLPWGSKDSK